MSGQTVALSWRLPMLSPAAIRLSPGDRLVAGREQPRLDRLGPAESFTATGVPPGRYYVRLHTVNHTGESPASSEIVIDVP